MLRSAGGQVNYDVPRYSVSNTSISHTIRRADRRMAISPLITEQGSIDVMKRH